MLIAQGRTATLGKKPWAGIELVSEARTEEAVWHLVQWSGKVFRKQPFQLLFPVRSRDLTGIRMISPYLFARCSDLEELISVSSIYGIQGLVKDGIGRTMGFPDEFVQSVIRESRSANEGWSAGVRKGSFVRVLLGREHMLCGTVRTVRAGIAEVEVSLKLRMVRLTIPVRALLCLDHVKKTERCYYYADSV